MKQAKKQKLSSRQTFLFKYVAPSLISISFLIMIYLSGESTMAPAGLISIYVPIALGIGFYIYFFGRLKTVSIDDLNLFVSNFSEDLVIPLSHLDRISEMKLFNPRRITLHLKQSSQFGGKIIFLGYHKQWLLFGTHPAVTEIRNRIKNNE